MKVSTDEIEARLAVSLLSARTDDDDVRLAGFAGGGILDADAAVEGGVVEILDLGAAKLLAEVDEEDGACHGMEEQGVGDGAAHTARANDADAVRFCHRLGHVCLFGMLRLACDLAQGCSALTIELVAEVISLSVGLLRSVT